MDERLGYCREGFPISFVPPLVSLLHLCCWRKWLTVGSLCSLSSGRKDVRIRGFDLVSAASFSFLPPVLTSAATSLVALRSLLSFCRIFSGSSLYLWRETHMNLDLISSNKQKKRPSRWCTYCWKSCWLERNLCKKSLKPTFFPLSRAVRQPGC